MWGVGGSRKLTDVSVAQASKVQLQGGSGQAGRCNHLLEVLPARLAVASNTSCTMMEDIGSGIEVSTKVRGGGCTVGTTC